MKSDDRNVNLNIASGAFYVIHILVLQFLEEIQLMNKIFSIKVLQRKYHVVLLRNYLQISHEGKLELL